MNADALNKLGDRVALAAGLVETNVAGHRRRPVTVAEFLAGRITPSLNLSGAEDILREAEVVLAADESACFIRSDENNSPVLVTLADAAAELRAALAAAEPFTIKGEEVKR